MINLLERLGRSTIQFIQSAGELALLFLQMLVNIGYIFKRPSLFVRELFKLGIRSLPIIILAGLFVGMVLSFQAYVNMRTFGAEASVGTLTALALFRELGPVLTGLLYTGGVSSALTAEIALMRATEQWASYELMAVNPVQYILTPRFFAGVLAVPILGVLYSAIGIMGGYLVATFALGVDGGAYWSQMQSAVDLNTDIVQGILVKTLVFGVITNLVALREGFIGRPTADGIARSTTSTVVKASLIVLVADFILTAILFG